MPRSHRLPDIAEEFPDYGQNLVRLVVQLAALEQQPVVLDVGANIGDSAAQILAAADARVWCIEGDPYWMPFLRRNLGANQRATLMHALLLPAAGGAPEMGAVRRHGTTTFVPHGESVAAPTLGVEQLAALNPWDAPVRLVKVDTDGFDTRLVPALMRAFSDHPPVLFFEYDPPMSVAAGDPNPEHVWEALVEHGYEAAVVWDNFGVPMGRLAVSEVGRVLPLFDKPLTERSFNYWDVAVVHRGDTHGHDVLAQAAGDTELRG